MTSSSFVEVKGLTFVAISFLVIEACNLVVILLLNKAFQRTHGIVCSRSRLDN